MLIRVIYWSLLPLLWLTVWAVALCNIKLRRGMLARRGFRAEFGKAQGRRQPQRPLVWVHAASAGEFLQAEPILKRLRERGAQLAVSLGSVSGLPWLERIGHWPELVWGGLLPFDFPWNARLLLRGLRPQAIVHVQAELWPSLVWSAQARGIPQLLIAARTGSGTNYRAHPLLRPFFRSLYWPLSAILCLTEADRDGIARIVPGHPGLQVAGDPGIETVLARLREAPPPALPSGWATPGAPLLVVGSSWPTDEALLLPALEQAFAAAPDLRVILAPHEPTPPRLRELESALEAVGTLCLSAVEGTQTLPSPAPKVILVDMVGRLASLYSLGNMAYVGGGHTTGVHNVAEPAACGLPVLFGPRSGNSAVAGLLLEAGAASTAGNEQELRAALLELLRDKVRRRVMGEEARAIVQAQAGAAQRCYEAVVKAVPELRQGR
ncbi:MAG: hypothetical protein O7B79_05675 [SAR324 cluster bacterium]|nr:hypothetical protein [SAR324 cluster bacterium]